MLSPTQPSNTPTLTSPSPTVCARCCCSLVLLLLLVRVAAACAGSCWRKIPSQEESEQRTGPPRSP
eukprot:12936494-Prorocentrum_lima.AAC.1